MLSENYNSIFKQTVSSFANNIKQSNDETLISKKYSLFYPSLGKNFLIDRQLLVIGQATNGWKPKWVVKDIPAQIDKIVTDSIEYSGEEKGICPLEWINEKWSEYNLFHLKKPPALQVVMF